MSSLCFNCTVFVLNTIGFLACSNPAPSSLSPSSLGTQVVEMSPPAKEAKGNDGDIAAPQRQKASGAVHFEGKLEVPLSLLVHVGPDGFALFSKSGAIAPNCLRLGKQDDITIPLKGDGAYDFDALHRCASRLKEARIEFREESAVLISAARDTQYNIVVRVIDALRGTDSEPLFREVTFLPVK